MMVGGMQKGTCSSDVESSNTALSSSSGFAGLLQTQICFLCFHVNAHWAVYKVPSLSATHSMIVPLHTFCTCLKAL